MSVSLMYKNKLPTMKVKNAKKVVIFRFCKLRLGVLT